MDGDHDGADEWQLYMASKAVARIHRVAVDVHNNG